MGFSSSERTWDRYDQIVEMKQGIFGYEPLREAIGKELDEDAQFRVLIVLSEQARQFVDIRESEVGYADPIQKTIVDVSEPLDQAVHRRANESVAELCASYLRHEDRWMVDNPDRVTTTEMQAADDAAFIARRWLNDHQEIVQRLDITYPDDKQNG